MIVTEENFADCLSSIAPHKTRACDLETTGLRPYHGDQPFSMIIGIPDKAWYFNFHDYGDHNLEPLPQECLIYLFKYLDFPDVTWVFHNAKFDCAFLAVMDIWLKGKIWCTKAMARVEYNQHFGHEPYSLASCLARLPGFPQKGDGPMEYLKANGLIKKEPIPGKKTQAVSIDFRQVPPSIIVPYGEGDGIGTAALQNWQRGRFLELDLKDSTIDRSLDVVVTNEMRLTKTVLRMEKVGVKIDQQFCERAVEHEKTRLHQAQREFLEITGQEFKDSSKVFEQVFAGEKDKWGRTDKGNPSFDSEYLSTFGNPAARSVLQARDAKALADFYYGFCYHADRTGVVHPNFDPGGTVHGRFSSSNPNFQNLKKDEDSAAQEFIVRRAIIPREGFKLVSIDYDTMEYRFALELACRLRGEETPFAKLINSGHEFHQATVDLVKKVASKEITRKVAKISNFLTLYGGGNEKLAQAIGSTIEEAKQIRLAIKFAAPEINDFIRACMKSAEVRGFVVNWLGRRSWFPDTRFCYRSPNYIVSGGCADIVKVAMNEIDDFLLGKKSRMLICVHDELVFEVHESESDIEKDFARIMASVFKHKFVATSCSISESEKSLGDLK